MQDRYAGDVGDFLNFALLRLLVAPAESPDVLLLGIQWYRVPDEDHNDDGKHIGYLVPGHRIGERLRDLDPDLHTRLGEVVRSGRSIEAIERSGALPPGTITHREVLDLRAAAGSAADRRRLRAGWVQRGLERLAPCDIVFADPDNGIRRSDHRVASSAPSAGKHAYLDELRPIVERGQSLVVYHHADRSGSVEQQVVRRFDDLRAAFPASPPLAAVRAARGSTRLFLVAPAPAHRDLLRRRLRSIEESSWAAELRVTWARVDAGRDQNRA